MNVPTNHSSMLIGSPSNDNKQKIESDTFLNSMQTSQQSPRGMSMPFSSMNSNNSGMMDPFMFMMSNMMNMYMTNPQLRQQFESQMGGMVNMSDNQNNFANNNM